MLRRVAVVVSGLALVGCGGNGAEPVELSLNNVRTFEQVGLVRLEETEDGTRVEVTAPEVSAPSAPAIRGGFCAELRPREYKLNEIESGRSVTDLDVPFDELLDTQLKVTVSRGERTPHRVVACTELPYDGPEPDVVLVDLLDRAGADEGLAWIEPSRPGRTKVGILLYDVVPGPRPAVIVRGGCRGEPAHELNEIRDSESVTEIEARLDALDDHSVAVGTLCGPIQPDSS